MPVCNIVKQLPRGDVDDIDALLHEAEGRVQ